MIVTRFAPSPTGYLHLGHAYSALLAWQFAQERGGQFLLRIEDIDQTRCRAEFIDALYEDLHWLGIRWSEPVRRQSAHFADYAAQLERLHRAGLLYPCFCTRADIAAEIARSPSAPHGPHGALYPGTCKKLSPDLAAARMARGMAYAWRLHMDQAALPALTWEEAGQGAVRVQPEMVGDIVLARKETPTSYHLSVTVDDALQGVTDVIRSEDLFFATHVHRILQAQLQLPAPRYHHHKIICDADGKRLAKRDGAITLRDLRRSGKTADDIRRMVGLA